MSLIGRTLSRYRVLDRLGEGGQGVVYRAWDQRLEREVAIKVFPADAHVGEAERRRIRGEALTLSRLNHPGIATIYDFDTSDGIDFIVMELVQGETLSSWIRNGPRQENEVIHVGRQIAEALSVAHKSGVLHRDIKPSNVCVTPEGLVKVLDFGLARLLPSRLRTSSETMTAEGTAVGTLPYMSPEQLRGEPLDERTDVYSLGVVLFEMALGRRPYPQTDPMPLMHAILHGTPDWPEDRHGRVSNGFKAILERCLDKDRARRYPSARALAMDLERPSQIRPRRDAARLRLVGTLLLAALVPIVLWGTLRTVGPSHDQDRPRSLAVLPLTDLSAGASQEFFVDGMTDELITRLSQVKALRVIARSSVMQYKGKVKPVASIAKELGVDVVLEGSVTRAGDRVRISARLIEPSTQTSLWADSYERSLSSVLALQSEVAQTIVDRIKVQVTPAERSRLARTREVDPEAHDAYLRGEFELNRYSSDGFSKARDHFLESIERDPGYAPAHAGLAWAFTALSSFVLPPREAMPRAKAEALAALQLDSTLVEGMTALGYVTGFYEWEWLRAEQDFRKAIGLYPADARAHQLYGYFLTVNGRFDAAREEFETAHRLDPLQGYIESQLLWPLYEGRRFGETVRQAGNLLRINPDKWDVSMILGQAYLCQGDYPRAIDALERAVELDANSSTIGWLAYGYGQAGRRGDAERAFARLLAMRRKSYVSPYTIGVAHLGLGRKEQAMRWLERATDERAEEIAMIQVDPALDALRTDPRFSRLVRRVGLRS